MPKPDPRIGPKKVSGSDHGTRVLLSDIEENKQLVSAEDCLFKTGDISDLASKLARLIDTHRAAVGQRVASLRQAVQMPPWSSIVQGYERVYESVLG